MVKVMRKSSSSSTTTMTKLFVCCSIVFLSMVILWKALPSTSTMKQMLINGTTSTTKMNVLGDDTPSSTYTEVDDNPSSIQKETLQQLVHLLRGDDNRLVQWDATEHTVHVQSETCPTVLPIALTILMHDSFIETAIKSKKDADMEVVNLSIEIAVLCITDNPTNRAIFAEATNENKKNMKNYNTIYDVIVRLLQVDILSASAAHLIYIASFANVKNHYGFVKANAVSALSTIILDLNFPNSTTTPYSIMWASAALQNLAASYCTTPDDGRCYWIWKKRKRSSNNDETTTKSFDYVLKLSSDSGSMIIDGTSARQEIIAIPKLIDKLIQWSCSGPVIGTMSSTNPYPGKNAVRNEHELSQNIVPWATTGTLKNLVLHPEIRSKIITKHNSAMSCFCYMSKSKDWLEANKGEGVLHHLRRDSDPCWFNFHDSSTRKKKKRKDEHVLCVDRVFIDTNGDTCEQYNDKETLTKEDCSTKDMYKTDGIFARTTCCQCGGGDLYVGPAKRKSG
jgi:hypothetical protein